MVVKVCIAGSSLLSPSPAGDAAHRFGRAVFYLVQRKKTIGKDICRSQLNPPGSFAFCALYISANAR
jgi:hypothetical protein